jgi:hypothetical protein
MQKRNDLFCGNAQAACGRMHARPANATLGRRFLQFVAMSWAGRGGFVTLPAWSI